METPEKNKKRYWLAAIPVVLLALSVLLLFKTGNHRKEKKEEKEKIQYQTILSDGTTFTKLKTDKKSVEALLEKAGYGDIRLEKVVEGKNKENQVVGTVYELCDRSGYGGDLTLLIGMTESDAICGIVLKDATKLVEETTEDTLTPFLEQFLYGRKDKEFWIEEQIFGGTKITGMDGAPVTSREIVRIVNCCRLLEDNRNTLTGGQEE